MFFYLLHEDKRFKIDRKGEGGIEFSLLIYSLINLRKNRLQSKIYIYILYFRYCEILFYNKISGRCYRFFAILQNFIFWIKQALKFTSSYVIVLLRLTFSECMLCKTECLNKRYNKFDTNMCWWPEIVQSVCSSIINIKNVKFILRCLHSVYRCVLDKNS